MAKLKDLKPLGWVRVKKSVGKPYADKEGIILSLGNRWAHESVIVALAFDNTVRRLTFTPSELKRLS